VTTEYIVHGEQVCALEYRKIRHRWLLRREVKKAQLSKVCHWPSVQQYRDEEAEEDDIIEVELADIQGLDRGWEKVSSTNNEVLFIHLGT